MKLFPDIQNPPISSDHFLDSVQRYNLLALATSEGIWDYNLVTGLTYYNNAILAMFNYDPDDMVDNISWWQNNIHPSDKKRVISEVDKLLQGIGNIWWGEYLFRCKDGSYLPVLERLYILRDDSGKAYRLVGTMQDLTRIKMIEAELAKEKLLRRQEMTRSIIKAEEAERKQISDELHENVNQVLAAINLHLDHAKEISENEKSIEWLNNAQVLLIKSMQDIRALSRQLTPFSLTVFGLIDALTDLLNSTTKRETLRFRIKAVANIEDRMSIEKKLMFYRIVQLHLKNVRMHASATMVHVNFSMDKKRVKLVITDDGQGFDPATLKYGYGFSRIHSKTEAYDGSFSVFGQQGKGCRIEVVI